MELHTFVFSSRRKASWAVRILYATPGVNRPRVFVRHDKGVVIQWESDGEKTPNYWQSIGVSSLGVPMPESGPVAMPLVGVDQEYVEIYLNEGVKAFKAYAFTKKKHPKKVL